LAGAFGAPLTVSDGPADATDVAVATTAATTFVAWSDFRVPSKVAIWGRAVSYSAARLPARSSCSSRRPAATCGRNWPG